MYGYDSCNCNHYNNIFNNFYYELPENVSIYLKIGDSYGLLYFNIKCSCCDFIDNQDYLFHNNHNDSVILKMKPIFKDNDIQLTLPLGDIGIFKKYNLTKDVNDNYIKDISTFLLNENLTLSEKWCLNSFYDNLHEKIKLKTRFKSFSNFAIMKRRRKTENSRLYALWFLSKNINEPYLCKKIICLAMLW